MSKDEPGDAVGTWETDSDGNKTYAFCWKSYIQKYKNIYK
jgi:hypothetical protein